MIRSGRLLALTLATAGLLGLVGLFTRGVEVARLNEGLAEAVRRGDAAACRALLKRGASPNARWDLYAGLRQTVKQVPPARQTSAPVLSLAAGGSSVEVLELLLDAGAEVNARSRPGVTPLMAASARGHTRAVRVLLERGADANARDQRGNSALAVAAEMGHVDTVQVLLEGGAAPGLADHSGRTPLSRARAARRARVMRLLEGTAPPPAAAALHDPGELPRCMDRILTMLKRRRRALADRFQPGLSRAQIERKTAGLPFRLPEEAYRLYMWRNGTAATAKATLGEMGLFNGTQKFLSLEEAHGYYRSLGPGRASWLGETPDAVRDAVGEGHLFPLFTDDCGGFWYVVCREGRQPTGPVIEDFGDGETPRVAYPSLTDMMADLAARYEGGATEPSLAEPSE